MEKASHDNLHIENWSLVWAAFIAHTSMEIALIG
jgi:hypothetical protein